MSKKNRKQLEQQNKKQTTKGKNSKRQARRAIAVRFILDQDGTVDMQSSTPNLALIRGITEEGLDIVKGADIKQYNFKQVARNRAYQRQQQRKQREDAKKWNQNEKSKLNKNVDKKNDK